MNSIYIGIIVDILKNLPEIASDVESAIKEAESPDDAKAKAKVILTDLSKLISTIIGVL